MQPFALSHTAVSPHRRPEASPDTVLENVTLRMKIIQKKNQNTSPIMVTLYNKVSFVKTNMDNEQYICYSIYTYVLMLVN